MVRYFVGFLCFAALAAAAPLRAELPPSVYKGMQDRAPEILSITVQSVAAKNRRGVARVLVTAKVTGVTRSKSGVTSGAVIKIAYETRTKSDGRDGPRPIGLLSKGKRYTAYLFKEAGGDYFFPTARAASFVAR
jgi:hypothetical protein